MDFKYLPSLEYLTSVKIGQAIIYNSDGRILDFDPLNNFPEVLKDVFDRLDDKLSSLTLPTKCCQKIRIIAMNMIQNFVIWRGWHSDIISESQVSANLCWTPLGTIDKLKTVRKYLNELSLDIVNRFPLACQYCLFHEASAMWEAMSETEKERSSNYTTLGRWICYRRNGNRCLESFIRWLEPQIYNCGDYQLLFILDKLTPPERVRILRSAAVHKSALREFRLFSFLQLDEDTKQLVLEEVPLQILSCFLTLPFQNCFLNIADRVWTIISPENFCDIVQEILDKLVTILWQNFELVEILQQLWHQSPVDFKDRVNQSAFSETVQILLNCHCLESLNINRLNEVYINSMRSRNDFKSVCLVFYRVSQIFV